MKKEKLPRHKLFFNISIIFFPSNSTFVRTYTYISILAFSLKDSQEINKRKEKKNHPHKEKVNTVRKEKKKTVDEEEK